MTEVLIAYLTQFVGTPYVYGGKNPLVGIDCSGFICEGLMAVGVLPFGSVLNAQALYLRFADPSGSREPVAAAGNLAFFGKDRKSIAHVGLCIGDGLMLESGGGDHTVTTLAEAKARGAFVKVRPIKYRRDFLEIVSLQSVLMAPVLP